ncbi:type II toxin-antitoxin system HicB family antitoxin [Candidatus Uhrbacteria bacterium]|nr:type II toxin-antitoxin system HicB family antitoxin [Candidatus Uhrbacteria bacterium]
MSYRFTILITKEKNWYVARCVELGVVSQGRTIEKAQDNLKEAVELYLEDRPREKAYAIQHAPLVSTLEIQYG